MTNDPVYERLAEYFLGEAASTEQKTSLASAIRESVEAWFVFRQTTVGNYLLGRSVETLDLSVRSYNGLKSAQIHTIGQLTSHTRRELSKLRYIGQRSLNEIEVILKDIGLELKTEEANAAD